MANEQNLRPKPFTSENQPENRGRKKGVPNRATVYKKILQAKMAVDMPDGSQKELTVYEAIALGQAKSAMKGNTNAWKEIQDSIHGKVPDKLETEANVTSTTTLIIQGVPGDNERTNNQGS